MTISAELRDFVRRRAKFCCEFCDVAETDVGDQLTLDHFQPKSKGGKDTLENLLYCCIKCNQYKQSYWPLDEHKPRLWNPRQESKSQHFLETDTGYIAALTSVGEFTIKRLRLNRAALVSYRLAKYRRSEEFRLLEQYGNLVQLLEQSNSQFAKLVVEQQKLLEEQKILIILLLKKE